MARKRHTPEQIIRKLREAEVVGAAGVVVTLVYLSVQIRRSTAQAKSDSFIKVNELAQGLGMKLADDLDFTKHVLMASEDWDSVSPERQFQAHMWNLVEVQLYETYYFMLLNGQITEETYYSREGHIARRLLSPGTRHWWDNFTYSLDPQFVERINVRLQSPSTLPPIAGVAFFDSSKWNISDD
jgi:hypothetical protein